MTWDREPARHSLSRRRIPNQAFGYKPNFVHYAPNIFSRDDKERRMLSTQDVYTLMTDPTTIESKYTEVAVPMRIGADLRDKFMTIFKESYRKKMVDADIQPDFLLDTYQRNAGTPTGGGASPFLYFISGGNGNVLRKNESIREAILVYMLAYGDKGFFWDNGEYIYIGVLSPQEKMVVLPKLLDMMKRYVDTTGKLDTYQYHIAKLLSHTMAGVNDKDYAVLRKMFSDFMSPMTNSKVPPFMKAARYYEWEVQGMDEHHKRTKVVYWIPLKKDGIDSTVVPNTNDEEIYESMLSWYSASDIDFYSHLNKNQIPKLSRRGLE